MRPGPHVPAVDADTVVLVEGDSDRVAVETLARCRELDLEASRTVVLAMGGVTNIGHHLRALAPGQRVLGLCDAGETAIVTRALERTGRSTADGVVGPDRIAALARLGFRNLRGRPGGGADPGARHRSHRAGAGPGRHLRAFRTLQNQPAQQGRATAQQLRRWFGSGATRKIRYAALMVEALAGAAADGIEVPAPLEQLMSDLGATVRSTPEEDR